MRAPIGDFTDARPAPDRLDLLTGPVADTAVFVEHHGAGLLDASANCVVVAARRGGDTTLAACAVGSATRVDVNGVVRRHLGARKASFALTDMATGESGMECGGITPVGLPAAWPLLVDAAVVDMPWVLVGSGRRRGKPILPGKALGQLPGAVVLEGLGVPVTREGRGASGGSGSDAPRGESGGS
ncbi:YbaK/EbsC family protein [Streptomyces sp. NPDC058861]|uniref:YbaK/EbsC family protein n=1 Tax=Streptomyces sp. NPDC058861 TaxID=3346653 RepID=UPI0036AAE477